MMEVRIRWEADFEVDSDSQEDLVDAARKAVGQISDPTAPRITLRHMWMPAV